MVFDDDLRNLSGEFCEELNDCFLELFHSSMDTAFSQSVEFDEYDDVSKVNYNLTVYICTVILYHNI